MRYFCFLKYIFFVSLSSRILTVDLRQYAESGGQQTQAALALGDEGGTEGEGAAKAEDVEEEEKLQKLATKKQLGKRKGQK